MTKSNTRSQYEKAYRAARLKRNVLLLFDDIDEYDSENHPWEYDRYTGPQGYRTPNSWLKTTFGPFYAPPHLWLIEDYKREQYRNECWCDPEMIQLARDCLHQRLVAELDHGPLHLQNRYRVAYERKILWHYSSPYYQLHHLYKYRIVITSRPTSKRNKRTAHM